MRNWFERFVPPTLRTAPIWVHVLINLFAWPGLGSVLRGRREGPAQALLALAGFLALLLFFALGILRAFGNLFSATERTDGSSLFAIYKPVAGWGWAGVVCFGLAWIWAVLSSALMLRQKTPPPLPRSGPS